jgi:hypothetical protein
MVSKDVTKWADMFGITLWGALTALCVEQHWYWLAAGLFTVGVLSELRAIFRRISQ